MKLDKDSIIGDILDRYPATAEAFLSMGMTCLGCPASRSESLAEACEVHDLDVEELLAELRAHVTQ